MTPTKTAQELGISEAEHSGLLRLKTHFETAKLEIVGYDDLKGLYRADPPDEIRATMGFAMDFGSAIVESDDYDCGCAACIGGHLSLMMEGHDVTGNCFTRFALDFANDYVTSREYDHPLGALFYPHDVHPNEWGLITPKLAAEAIGNFLTTGKPDWKGIAARESFPLTAEIDD